MSEYCDFGMEQNSSATRPNFLLHGLSGILLTAAVLSLAAILADLSGLWQTTFLHTFWQSFHVLSFYLPALLLVSSRALLRSQWLPALGLLSFGILPLVTLNGILQILLATPSQFNLWLVERTARSFSLWLLSGLFALQVLLLLLPISRRFLFSLSRTALQPFQNPEPYSEETELPESEPSASGLHASDYPATPEVSEAPGGPNILPPTVSLPNDMAGEWPGPTAYPDRRSAAGSVHEQEETRPATNLQRPWRAMASHLKMEPPLHEALEPNNFEDANEFDEPEQFREPRTENRADLPDFRSLSEGSLEETGDYDEYSEEYQDEFYSSEPSRKTQRESFDFASLKENLVKGEPLDIEAPPEEEQEDADTPHETEDNPFEFPIEPIPEDGQTETATEQSSQEGIRDPGFDVLSTNADTEMLEEDLLDKVTGQMNPVEQAFDQANLERPPFFADSKTLSQNIKNLDGEFEAVERGKALDPREQYNEHLLAQKDVLRQEKILLRIQETDETLVDEDMADELLQREQILDDWRSEITEHIALPEDSLNDRLENDPNDNLSDDLESSSELEDELIAEFADEEEAEPQEDLQEEIGEQSISEAPAEIAAEVAAPPSAEATDDNLPEPEQETIAQPVEHPAEPDSQVTIENLEEETEEDLELAQFQKELEETDEALHNYQLANHIEVEEVADKREFELNDFIAIEQEYAEVEQEPAWQDSELPHEENSSAKIEEWLYEHEEEPGIIQGISIVPEHQTGSEKTVDFTADTVPSSAEREQAIKLSEWLALDPAGLTSDETQEHEEHSEEGVEGERRPDQKAEPNETSKDLARVKEESPFSNLSTAEVSWDEFAYLDAEFSDNESAAPAAIQNIQSAESATTEKESAEEELERVAEELRREVQHPVAHGQQANQQDTTKELPAPDVEEPDDLQQEPAMTIREITEQETAAATVEDGSEHDDFLPEVTELDQEAVGEKSFQEFLSNLTYLTEGEVVVSQQADMETPGVRQLEEDIVEVLITEEESVNQLKNELNEELDIEVSEPVIRDDTEGISLNEFDDSAEGPAETEDTEPPAGQNTAVNLEQNSEQQLQAAFAELNTENPQVAEVTAEAESDTDTSDWEEFDLDLPFGTSSAARAFLGEGNQEVQNGIEEEEADEEEEYSDFAQEWPVEFGDRVNSPMESFSMAEAAAQALREKEERQALLEEERAQRMLALPVAKSWGSYEVSLNELIDYDPEEESRNAQIDADTKESGEALLQTLKKFKIEAEMTHILKGPSITEFGILPAPGIKLNRVEQLADNLAMELAARSIRIVAPIPGKKAVGIEIPNRKRSTVSFPALMDSEEMRKACREMQLPIVLGKEINGAIQIADLRRMPHLLIAGATGSGKSVCVNVIISSLILSKTPQQLRLMMIDPKIVELKQYNDIPHLLTPVITDAQRGLQALEWVSSEMERRYALLDAIGAGNKGIESYNRYIKETQMATLPLEYIVVIIDEFADLMSLVGKELEGMIARLAAMSRAVGIHLVLATQRPSVDVVTGLIKANFPTRIAFMVASQTDSRTILDQKGAEQLLGQGDMLFSFPGHPLVRVQGAYLAEEDAENISSHIKSLGEPAYLDEIIFEDDDAEETHSLESGSDELFPQAVEMALQAGEISTSFIQRKLSIGYNRAARIIDEMEERGIIGPAQGSKKREVLHSY